MVRDMDRKELKLFDPDRERERVKTEEEDLRIRFHKADALVAHIGRGARQSKRLFEDETSERRVHGSWSKRRF
ncbi:hypothetical protein HZH68_011467 [Vespula germanica]|uniref:Uncharacterized protein n=1 Tax=Vespula germanica TaxID=30212 RepID=A0A834N1U5_VESGE|nr:hypothetical protein HZH68_011467 [Vespula germanica]